MREVDYSCIEARNYGYVPECSHDMEQVQYYNKVVGDLVDEFQGLTKNIISHSEAIKYWKNNYNMRKRKNIATDKDVEDAYQLCYGNDFEYEWEQE